MKFQSDALRRIAWLDGLTIVYNRRYFGQQVEIEWERCQQHDLPFAVVMVDVDYFKSYNDYYGHLGGDDCLVAIAKAIESCVPNDSSFLARYGGEEFALVLLGGDFSQVQQITDLVLSAVRALALPHGAGDAKEFVSISLGCCVVQSRAPAMSLSEIIASADKYLYQAKGGGRDNAIIGVFESNE